MELIKPPSPDTPGCPFGWFGMALAGQALAGTQEIRVQNMMPPCIESRCKAWQVVETYQVGGEDEVREIRDCVVFRAFAAIARGGEES